MEKTSRYVEWPTLGLWFAIVLVWSAALWVLAAWSLAIAALFLVPALVLHASLTHEVIHGHPFASRRLSEALVWINPGLFVPFARFRDLHLRHHMDARLTDPYDDPESNYLDCADWKRLPKIVQVIRRWNNTLLGRIVLGPALGQWDFMRSDWRAIRMGEAVVARAWALHMLGCVAVLWAVSASAMPIWLYLLCCYAAAGILRIRTFLEHQAHDHASGRTVIIEARCPLAFLFLFNSLHVVHHMHPRLPWYRLPRVYQARRDALIDRKTCYFFPSYTAVFKAYFLRAKDPVPHPLWSRGD